MIIFDLDCLADDSHRRHFIDPKKNENYERRWHPNLKECTENKYIPEEYIKFGASYKDCVDGNYELFIPNYSEYDAACVDDNPIEYTKETLISLNYEPYKRHVSIWTSRCESQREKSLEWIDNKIYNNSESREYIDRNLKMRPVGDKALKEYLFHYWIGEYVDNALNVEMVFSSHKPTIDMFRRCGVFVFDCNQGE